MNACSGRKLSNPHANSIVQETGEYRIVQLQNCAIVKIALKRQASIKKREIPKLISGRGGNNQGRRVNFNLTDPRGDRIIAQLRCVV